MSVTSEARADFERRRIAFRRALGGAGLGVFIVLLLLALFHEQLAPIAAGAAGAGAPLTPPGPFHPLGTDILGRDLWSETLHGLAVTFSSAVTALIVTLLAGALAGRAFAHLLGQLAFGFRIIANVLVSIPAVLLAILLIALLGVEDFALAVGLAVAPSVFLRSFDYARRIREAPYSEYARASGVTNLALLRRDLVHELRAPFIGDVARMFSSIAIVLSTVSFFGFGSAPPERDLGLIIATARANLPDAWWTALGPAVVLVLLIMASRFAAGLAEDEHP